MRGLLAGALAAIALLAAWPPVVSAAPGPPVNLEPVDGLGWRADSGFLVGWSNPTVGTAPTAVRYLVRDEAGSVVDGPARVDWPTERLSVDVPRHPGVYTIEVRLEDASGAESPPASTPLRFDDTRPADVGPIPTDGWVGRAQLPFRQRISRPAGAAAPPAGIRGYAISVDHDPEGRPCLGAERCTDAETDLRGGIADDTLPVELPDGASFVHAVAVSGSGMRSAAVGTVPIHVDRLDPVTELTGAPEGWVSHSVVLRARATDAASGMRAAGTAGPFTAIRVDGGAPTVTLGAAASATVIESGAHRVAYYARDAAGNVDDGAASNGRVNQAPGVAIVRIDRGPPRMAFLPSTHAEEPELIEARVEDDLSGPSGARGWIGVRPVGSDRPFDPLPTTVDGGILRCRWSSDRYRDGDYEFEATGYDRAGNAGSGRRRQNGTPMVLRSPLKTGTRLSGRLGGRSYRGRLEQTSGAPLAGMQVQVIERFDPSARLPTRVTGTVTGAGGAYAVALAPGPSREVFARFGGSRTKSPAASPPASLEIRTRIRLRASTRTATVGGRPVIFTGSIANIEVPADNVSVQLQFKLPGLPWTEFRTVSTDRRGRFRYPYRFADDDSRGVRFLFRAYVPEQDGWPYAPGGSLPVWVRGQ